MRFLSSPTASFLPLFLSSLIILQSLAAAAAADIPLGSTLTPSNASTWISQNRTFSVGFFPYPQNPSLYVAAVNYTGGVPVWSAGGINSSGAVDSRAVLELRADGNLRLVNGSGTVVWESSTADKGVSSAVILDSGNFQLVNSSSSVVWQSFDHPTDTIVESQNFTSGEFLRSGSYSFTLGSAGNLTLTWNDSTTYYNKGLNSSFSANKTLGSPTLTIQTDGIVSLFDTSTSSSAEIAFSSNYGESGDMLRFLRLDDDGNMRAYSSARGTGATTNQWSAVDDQCEVFGYCGNMGMCSYNDTSPVCGCPSGNFKPSDPSDSRQGCKMTKQLTDCPQESTMLELDHTKFLTYPPDTTSEQYFVGITACKQNCLSGSCVASTSLADGSGHCYLKVSNFVSGYQSAALPSISFVKVCSPGLPNQPSSTLSSEGNGSSRLRGWVVAIVVVGTIGGLAILELGLWWCFCRHNPKFGTSAAQYALLEYASGAPVQFSYKELHRRTKGFKEKLGAGGFGVVYKGILANRTVVAVKQLEGIEQGEKQFRMEVATISSTHHLNLVRLIGFCSEGRHRLLVYEFMKNGSLDSFLFPVESSRNLTWAARFNIAIGTARGITYLHEECRDCIVHCDVKPENILLDDNYNAKVSDFGLAKLINLKDHRHRSITSVRGTRGYLAPEWLANLPITSKSDVYSYGMVLLEIVSGRRNFDVSDETGKKKFSLWAYEEFERGNIGSITDKKIPEEDVNMEELERAIQVSFWCTQEQPSQRPSMGKVVQMLEGVAEIERPPAPKVNRISQNVTSISGFTGSGPALSMTSSFQATGSLSSIDRGDIERASGDIERASLSRSAT